MDIRTARKAQGNIPPEFVAEEPETIKTAELTETEEPVVTELDPYGGDLVIAGYMDYLGKNGITKDDIAAVLDSIIASGSVSWNFELLGRINVEFIVRPAWVDDYIAKTLDRVTSQAAHVSNIRYSNLVAECNLAASLHRYGDNVYTIKDEDDLSEARERIRSMPYMITVALIKKLSVFDRVIACAMSDWAVENFTKPLKENSGAN